MTKNCFDSWPRFQACYASPLSGWRSSRDTLQPPVCASRPSSRASMSPTAKKNQSVKHKKQPSNSILCPRLCFIQDGSFFATQPCRSLVGTWKSLKVMIMISTLKVLGWKSLKVAPNESKDCEGRNVSGPYLTRLHTQERDNNKDCLKILKDKAFL